tara:strand:+ start:105 stop:602 length:498 start_codon:yes stop_codon:yes gene_type:complete
MNISLDAMAKKYEEDLKKNLEKNEAIQPKNRNNINTGGKVEGANLRETTVTESAKRTSDLNKAAKKTKDKPDAMSKYGDQLKALLSNKDKLVGTKVEGDSRNKYQIQIQKLKERMKADGLKFNSLLNAVKKQEREGEFDRGAEGKAKNKLRKKMMSEKIGGSRGR